MHMQRPHHMASVVHAEYLRYGALGRQAVIVFGRALCAWLTPLKGFYRTAKLPLHVNKSTLAPAKATN